MNIGPIDSQTRWQDFDGVDEMDDRWVHDEAFDIAGWNLLSTNDDCSVPQVSFVILGLLQGDHMELDTSCQFQDKEKIVV